MLKGWLCRGDPVSLQCACRLEVMAFLKSFPGTPKGSQPNRQILFQRIIRSEPNWGAGRYNETEAVVDRVDILGRETK